MERISDVIRGKLKIEAFGALPESLLNAAALNAVELWNTESVNDNTLRFEIYEFSFPELKRLAEDHSIELTVLSHIGGSRNRGFIRRRGGLLIAAFLMTAVLLIQSLFIWNIDIRGNERLSSGEILRTLDECGVGVGSYWPSLSADTVRTRMMLALPDIGWMTVNISGARAIVLIKEREPKPIIYNEAKAADIIAAKRGVIRRVSVLAGKPAVETGQAVVKGEVLVNGTLDSTVGGIRTVRSRASVMAETWYEINAVCPQEEEIKEYSGSAHKRFAVIIGKRRINFYLNAGKPIDGCDKINKKYTLGADGLFYLPIQIIKEELIPYKTYIGGGYDADEMKSNLNAMLDGSVEGQILESSFSDGCSKGLYVLTLRAHCIENIAETRELTD